MKTFARLSLSLSLSVGALLAATGCPGEVTPPPPKPPPQISVTVPRSNVVGSEVPFTVNITGCETVSQLDVYDQLTFLKTIPATLPSTQATLLPNEFDYRRGLALPIALNAKVTCGDGRTATSRTQALTFLPVERVVSLPNDEQVVTDLFTAEGSGESTTFIGCFVTEGGYTAIARVNVAGEVVKESDPLPFTCTHETVFTDRNPVSGKRWVFDPAGGAVAITDDLRFRGRYSTQINQLLVAPNGDAIIVVDTGLHFFVARQSHEPSSTPAWKEDAIATLIGRPAVTPGGVFVPVKNYDVADADTEAGHHISVMRLDLATGGIAGHHLVLTDATDTVPFTAWPDFNVTVSDDGAQVYVPRLVDDDHAALRACPVVANGCTSSSMWETTVFEQWPLVILPYANGSRLAAVSQRRAAFFNANAQGAVFGQQLFPQGAAQFFTQAVPSKSEAFFLMSASLNAQGAFNLPAEIIAIDSAQQGELFRYQAPAGSVAMSYDDSGHPWMRVGPTLVKPFPLADYRAALNSGQAPGQ